MSAKEMVTVKETSWKAFCMFNSFLIYPSQPSDIQQFDCHLQWLFAAVLWVFYLNRIWAFLPCALFQYPNSDHMSILQFLPWKPSSFCILNFCMHIYFSSGDIICNIIYEGMNLFLFNIFYWIYICVSKYFNENTNY